MSALADAELPSVDITSIVEPVTKVSINVPKGGFSFRCKAFIDGGILGEAAAAGERIAKEAQQRRTTAIEAVDSGINAMIERRKASVKKDIARLAIFVEEYSRAEREGSLLDTAWLRSSPLCGPNPFSVVVAATKRVGENGVFEARHFTLAVACDHTVDAYFEEICVHLAAKHSLSESEWKWLPNFVRKTPLYEQTALDMILSECGNAYEESDCTIQFFLNIDRGSRPVHLTDASSEDSSSDDSSDDDSGSYEGDSSEEDSSIQAKNKSKQPSASPKRALEDSEDEHAIKKQRKA